MKIKIRNCLFLVALLLCFPANLCFADTNLIQNSSFEQESGFWPSKWNISVWDGTKGASEFFVESGNAHSGNRVATIRSEKENDARYKQSIDVIEDKIYRFSCWVKAENVGTNGKGVNLSVEGIMQTSEDIKGTTKQWSKLELYLKTGKGMKSVTVTLGIGGYGSTNTGSACFDDVEFVEMMDVPAGIEVIPLHNSTGDVQGGEMMKQDTKENKYLAPMLVLVGFIIVVAIAALLYYKARISRKEGLEELESTAPSDDIMKYQDSNRTVNDGKGIVILDEQETYDDLI